MSNRDDQPKGFDALSLISERLGSLFKDVVATVEHAKSVGDANNSTGEREFTLPSANGPIKGMVSYGFRSGSAAPRGAPQARRAHTPQRDFEVKRPPRAETTKPDTGVREPVIELFDEANALVLTAELPGVSDAEISISFPDPTIIIIETTGRQRFHAARVLPIAVTPDAMQRQFRNGILELQFLSESRMLNENLAP